MYTEDEARKMCCVRGIAINCFASECMAWRWGELRYTNPSREEYLRYIESGMDETTIVKHGYCGLAGKP